jgi:hypothetical protein
MHYSKNYVSHYSFIETEYILANAESIYKNAKFLYESSDEAVKLAKSKEGFSSKVEHEIVKENIKKFLKKIEYDLKIEHHE